MLDLATVRARCAGAIVAPGDPGYAQARRECGLTAGQEPAAIGFPLDGDDVARMVGAAREAGLRVALQLADRADGLGDLARSLLLNVGEMGYAAA
jgi:hypothetical protein